MSAERQLGIPLWMRPQEKLKVELFKNAAKAIVRNAAPRLAFRLSLQNHFWDEIELDVLDLIVNPNRAAIDVGANTGRYAAVLVKIAAHVFAVEPNPHVAQLLIAGLDANKVTVLQKAVSHSSGEAILTVPTDRWGNGGENLASLARHFNGPTKSICVQLMTLNELCNENIGFIKLDIEGHELDALRGGVDLIQRRRPTILIECDALSEGEPESFRFLKSLGYHGWFIHRRNFYPLYELRPEMHDVSAFCERRPRKEIEYTNNFIFFPEALDASREDAIRKRLLNQVELATT